MFELDDGLEEIGDAVGDLAQDEAEDVFEESVEEFDSDSLLAHWNSKEAAPAAAQHGQVRHVPSGPTIKEILTRLESQLRNQFGSRVELLEVPLDRARSTLRSLFPPRTRPGPTKEQHEQLQLELFHALNQIEDIMDSLVVSTQAGAK